MLTKSEPTTWRILPTNDGHFQWAIASGDAWSRSEEPCKTLVQEADDNPVSRLPSMADLLLQAEQNLLSNKGYFLEQHVAAPKPKPKPGGIRGGNDCGSAMFSTGSGRTLSLRHSSIEKAKFLLEGENVADKAFAATCGSECFPLFHTGLGNAVQARQSSIRKAATLLEGSNEKQDHLMDQLDTTLPKNKKLEKVLMDSSHRIGKTIDGVCTATFQTYPHSDLKDFGLPENSLCKDAVVDHSMHAEQDNTSTCPPLKFHTAGGRSISISADALKHARTLLNDPGSDFFYSEIKANELAYSACKNEKINDKASSNIKNVSFDSSNNSSFLNRNLLEIPSSVTQFCCPRVECITSSALSKQIGSKKDHFSGNNGGFQDFGLPENSVCKDAVADYSTQEVWDNKSTCPPLKFHTAGGRSISVSAGALKRARVLLDDLGSGGLDSEVKANKVAYSTCENGKPNSKAFNNIRNVSFDSLYESSFLNRNVLEIPSSSVKQFCCPLMAPITSSAFSKQVDSRQDHLSRNNGHCSNPPNDDFLVVHRKVPCSIVIPKNKSAVGPLVDISNYTISGFGNKSCPNGEKQKPGKRSSSLSFKRPRTSRFTAPLNCTFSNLVESALPSTSVNCCCRTRVSSRYPIVLQRKKLKEFFGRPPGRFSMIENVPEAARYMTADNAKNYRFHDNSSVDLGPEAFKEMLLQSGALLGDTSEKWVTNHYKWIVWKLACLERCYPSQAINKFLTICNVLEELKYRYEREFNYGHKSALKKILEGDISPSSMIILCVSAIRSCLGPRTDEVLSSSDLPVDGNNLISSDSNYPIKIELTDGWYSLDATLDVHLSKQLIARKLFVGQKLRICGATLCGWIEPISPLEASMVSFVLHINGAFRAQWADSLGLCKGLETPLAFRCIKGGGGRVPRTLVGILRLYPVLYKERLPNGGSIVRSESMEKRILHRNSQRRSEIAEAIISELEDAPINDNDSEEGAKIFRILEGSAEPEVLMAGMSSEQLVSISSYQARQEALRQDNLHKKIEKAFEEAGLGSRDVTPFMRVRVIGLICVGSFKKGRPREGLITIWNPTEKQKFDLVEGQIYSVSSLVPLSGGSDFLYLQTRGPSSEWTPLPSTDSKKFKPFFTPRESVPLSNLGEVPLASEFDISAVVVHVGNAYVSGCQRKQWIFVTDGSRGIHSSSTEDQHDDGLLAISFRSPIFDNDSLAPINRHLSGCIVGFCNLIKRARDQNNHLWVADTTENSTYSLSHNISSGSHLKEAADSASKWAKTSPLALQKLQKRVLCITGDDEI